MARFLGWLYAFTVAVALAAACAEAVAPRPEICSAEAFVRESTACVALMQKCPPCDQDECPPCDAEDQCNAWAAERTRVCTEEK